MKKLLTGLLALILTAATVLNAAADNAPQIVWLENGMSVLITTLTSATETMELIPVVKQEGGVRKCGFVNTAGEVVIEPQFDSVWPFSDGMARVAVKDETGTQLHGYIDTKGNFLIEPQYHSIGLFCSGLALVMRKDEDGVKRYGYINTSGEEVIPLTFEYAESFIDGCATVGVPGGDNHLYGLINTEGKYLCAPQYSHISPCSDGLFLVVSKGGTQYGYIDKNGDVVIPLQYVYAQSFSEGLAAVQLYAGPDELLYGYINTAGELVIEPQFASAEPFSDGFAVVKELKEDGYYTNVRLIDRTGNFVTSDEYHTKSYADGFALTFLKYSSGRIIFGWACPNEGIFVRPTYAAIVGDASHGLVCAGKSNLFGDTKYGYVTPDNRTAVPFRYDSATAFSGGLAVVGEKQDDDKMLYGCLNTAGELALSVEYNSIIVAKNIVALTKDGRSGFFVNSGYGQEHTFTGTAKRSLQRDEIIAAVTLPAMIGVYLFLVIRDHKYKAALRKASE